MKSKTGFRAVFFAALYATSSVVWAQVTCAVTVKQRGAVVSAAALNGWSVYVLKKEPFELVVSPTNCTPVFATLPDTSTATEVASMPAVVWTGSGYAYATSPGDEDVLNWPSRAGIKLPPEEFGDDWTVRETYEAETKRLGYKPTPIRSWGVAAIFKDEVDFSIARFARLTQTRAIDTSIGNLSLPAVIYTRVKDLMKPTWHNAVATTYLASPYRIVFQFSD